MDARLGDECLQTFLYCIGVANLASDQVTDGSPGEKADRLGFDMLIKVAPKSMNGPLGQ